MNKNLRIVIIVVLVASIGCILIGLLSQGGNKKEETQTTTTTINTNNDNTTTTTTTVPTTTKSAADIKKEYISKCKTYKYKDIARNPDNYINKDAKFTGEVVQALYDDGLAAFRINVTCKKYKYISGYSCDDTMWVLYYPEKGESKILEDDMVTVYGYLTGEYSYESVLGSTITIPSMNAKYIDLKK